MAYTKTGEVLAAISRTKRREEVDIEKLLDLASIGFTQDQICDYFGVGRSQLESNQDWIDAWREGHTKFKEVIIRGQYEVAADANHKGRDKMLVWLGKIHLNQREIQQVESNTIGSFDSIMKILKDDERDDTEA